MHKRKLHHLLVRLRPISYWYFVGLFLLFGLIAAFALRHNNLRALELRDNVLKVDKQNGDIEEALRELREYTYSHMNTNLASDTGIYPPIQLKYRYERLVAAEQARLKRDSSDIYAAAQKDCERRFPGGFSGSNRLPCIQAYIDTHGKTSEQPRDIPESLYKFDFVAPLWAPDIAGWAILLALVSLLLLITRITAQVWLRAQLGD